MLCVVDIGNTHTLIGLYDGERLAERWRMQTDQARTMDEWGLILKNLLDLTRFELGQVSAISISSVVPPAVHALEEAARKYLDIEALVVGPGVKTGLAIRYENPREVGADRVVNAVAALARSKGACIVVDFGTATTFDCLSASGEYLGGAIAPGIGIALDALVTHAAKLPRVEVCRPKNVVGRNTVESIQSGVLYGYVSLVDGLVDKLSEEMETGVEVFATGGFAELIAEESKTISAVDPDLTLEGLRLLYLLNCS